MVVDVASDALLDSPGRLFWPVILRHSSRGAHQAPRRSFCNILLLSTLPSHISNSNAISRACVRARPTNPTVRLDRPHFTTTYSYSSSSSCRTRTTTSLLPATPATLSPPSLSSISHPASTSTLHVILLVG